MKDLHSITREHFIKRLGDLCLKSGLSGLPKNESDQQILLKSAVLMLDRSGKFSEPEINERLKAWVRDVSQIKELDHVSLRRQLVDTGYLKREPDGSRYWVAVPGPQPDLFDPTIDQLDIPQVIETLREEIARRKKEHLERSGG